MKKVYSRKDSIVKITTNTKQKVDTDRIWLNNPTYLGFIPRRPGVYQINCTFPIPAVLNIFVSDEPNENEVVENGIIYYKPNILFENKSGQTTKMFFNTKEEMDKFIKDFISDSDIEWVYNN